MYTIRIARIPILTLAALAALAVELLACGSSTTSESTGDGSAEASAADGSLESSADAGTDSADASLGPGADAALDVTTPSDYGSDDSTPTGCSAATCDGGTCSGGRCITTLATGQNAPFALVADGANVYWTNGAHGEVDAGSVMRVPVGGGTAPVALASGVTQPKYIVSDDARVYWTELTTVNAWDKSSGTLLTLASGQSFPTGIAVDSAYVYWTNGDSTGSPGLFRTALDGGAPTLVASYGGNAEQLVISPTLAYWNSVASAYIFTAPLGGDGSAPTVFYLNSDPEVQGIGIDSNNFYFTEHNALGTVDQLPLGGGAVTLLSSNNLGTEGVVSDGTYVYFTSANGYAPSFDGAILRVPVGGGTIVTIATGNLPDSIAIDAASVYWASSQSGVVLRATPR